MKTIEKRKILGHDVEVAVDENCWRITSFDGENWMCPICEAASRREMTEKLFDLTWNHYHPRPAEYYKEMLEAVLTDGATECVDAMVIEEMRRK